MMKPEKILELKGGNLDIDLIPNPNVPWKITPCPWNEKEKNTAHKCAVKNVSICKFFHGIKDLDVVLCSFDKTKI